MKFLNKKIIGLVLLNFILLGFNILPLLASAAGPGYQLLEPSIKINEQSVGTGEYGLKEYLQTAYLVLFVVVISAVVFWFIIGGLEYILSDLPSVKLGGKAKLIKALIGLGIALSSWLLLNLINPELLKFKDLTNSGESQTVPNESH